MVGRVYSRQSFLGTNSDKVFARLRVGVIGVGGSGSHVVQQLAHIGIGHLIVPDPDVLKAHNLNRTIGARWTDVAKRTPKSKIAKRLAEEVNPKVKIAASKTSWANLMKELAACDVIVGCVDTYQHRAELEAFARRHHIPYIDMGMDVSGEQGAYVISGQVIASVPGYPCMRCLGFLTEEKLAKEAANYGNAGGRPQVVWANGLLASAAVGTLIRWICPWDGIQTPLTYLDYDGNKDCLTEHNRLRYLSSINCQHYSNLGATGMPFWKPAKNLSDRKQYHPTAP